MIPALREARQRVAWAVEALTGAESRIRRIRQGYVRQARLELRAALELLAEAERQAWEDQS